MSIERFTSPFGSWLKNERDRLKISQRGLARQIGVSHTTIREIERGSRFLSTTKTRILVGVGGVLPESDSVTDPYEIPVVHIDVNVNGILARNAENFGTTSGEILRRGGSLVATQARKRSHREMRDAGMTFQAIGDAIGGRDHSTIISNVRRDIADGSEIVEVSKAELDIEIEQYLEENFPGVSFEDVCGERRIKELVVPRQALTRHLFYNIGLNIERISDRLNRDHSTILYAINKPEDEMQVKVKAWKKLVEKKAKKEAEKAEKVPMELKVKQQLEEEKRRMAEMPAIIFTVIASTFQLEENEIISRSMKGDIVWARHLIAYFLSQYTDLSFDKIAEMLNRSDHSISINSISRVEEKMDADEEVMEDVEEMKGNILDLLSALSRAKDNSESAVTEISPSI